MIIGLRRSLEHDAQAFHPVGRKCRRKDGIALDDTGIAIRRPLAGRCAVDQRDREAPLRKVDPNRGADDPGPQHNDIGARHRTSFVVSANLAAASPEAASVVSGGQASIPARCPARNDVLRERLKLALTSWLRWKIQKAE